MSKRLNLRFAIYLVGSFAVLGTATHFLHGFQVRRTAGALLDRASQVEAKGQLDLAADYLGRYVSMNPADTNVLARYGGLLADDRLAKSDRAKYRAFVVLNRVLYREPGRLDVRRQVVRLAMAREQFTNARDDIKTYLLPAFPKDGELAILLGRCWEALGQYRDARQSFEDAIRDTSHDLESYSRLARLLRDHTRDVLRAKETPAAVVAQADRVMEDMVQANAQAFRAYLLRANYRRKHGVPYGDTPALEAAAQDVTRAQKLAPEEADVFLASADIARERQRPDDARGELRRGCDLRPKDWRLWLAAAKLEIQLGQSVAALERLSAGLRELPRQPDLLWELAALHTAAGRQNEAKDAMSRLEKQDFPAPYLNCLRARLLMHEERWQAAIVKLEGAYAALIGRTNQTNGVSAAAMSQQAGVWLGECFEQVGDADRAYEAYSRVAARNEQSVVARQGMASARWVQGRLQEALDQYRQLQRLPGAPANGWVEVARLVLLRNLEMDEANRHWPEVDQALKQAERLQPLPPAVVVLRAEFWAAQRDYERARTALLEKYGDPKARPAEVWVGLAAVEERQGRPAAALAMFDDAQRQCGDVVEVRLARTRYWLRRGRDQAREALPPLAAGLEQFSALDRRRLLLGLAQACLQVGLTAEGGRLWQRLADEQPGDLRSRIELFDLAAGAGDGAGMDRWQNEIRRIEGEDGVLWRFARASVLVGQGIHGNKANLPEARRLLNDIAIRRPNWSRVVLCEARLNDLEGMPDNALSLYLKALQLGESDPTAVGRAVLLLHQRRRYAEANDLLRRLPDETLLPQGTQRVAAEVALRSQDKVHARELAERAVTAASKDYKDHLWLGYIYWATGQLDRAESALVRARDLAPTAPEVWLTLVQFRVSNGQKARAVTEVAAADRNPTAAAALPVLAQCHELVDQKDRARDLFQAALRTSGDDATVLRAAAEFFFRIGQPGPAQEILVRLVGNRDRATASWARRTRALVLAAEGGPDKFQEALALLGGADSGVVAPSDTEAVQDMRTKAHLLALQNTGPARRSAVRMLDELLERQVAEPQDHLLAGQLREALGDWPKARQRYLTLLALPDNVEANALATVARSLLRHGEVESGARVLGRLESLSPQGTVTKEVRARLLHAEGRTDEAVAIMRESARAEGADLPAAAAVLEDFGDFAGAEDLFRTFVAQPQRSQDGLVLAKYLIRRGRFAEALDLCDRSWSICPPTEVAQTCLLALSKMTVNADRLARIASHLEAAIDLAPDKTNLLAAKAAVCNYQGRFEEAVALYRRVLEKDARHVTALNNLAWLLALQDGHGQEALELVTRAIGVAGPGPGLLDTRAVAYLALGRRGAVDLAVKDLELTVAEAASPTAFFHLARAYDLAGRHRDAVRAWEAAKTQGLSVDRLHPLERVVYQRLAPALN